MSAVDDLIAACEMYYTTDDKKPKAYNAEQRRAIVKRLGWIGQDIAIKINDRVREIYGTDEFALPGLSVLLKALHDLGDAPQKTTQQQLPAPEFDVGAYLDDHKDDVDEAAEKERNRIEAKKHRSRFEEWWLLCKRAGGWWPMPIGWDVGMRFVKTSRLAAVDGNGNLIEREVARQE